VENLVKNLKFLASPMTAVLMALAITIAVSACNKNDPNAIATTPQYAVSAQPCNVGATPQVQAQPISTYNNFYYWWSFGSKFKSNLPVQQNLGSPEPTALGNCTYNGNVGNWYYGRWYWPQAWQPSASNCGCPVGYMSVYAQQYGVACAPATYGNLGTVVYWNVNWYGGQAQNSFQLNMPQAQFTGTLANNCSTATAQGCDTRLNNCPSGSICQAAGGGSTIGICIQP
jgi:hypothetical protein